MSIERNCPIEILYAPEFQIFLRPQTEVDTIAVIQLSELDKLFKALTKECKSWQESDGRIYYDSPEKWLRKQIGELAGRRE
jgi:hypothetical protein